VVKQYHILCNNGSQKSLSADRKSRGQEGPRQAESGPLSLLGDIQVGGREKWRGNRWVSMGERGRRWTVSWEDDSQIR